MLEKQGVFQGLIFPGCRFALVFAQGRGQLREGAAVGHSSSGSTTRCNGITSSTIPPRCCKLSLEAPSGQVCLTPVRGCSSWCTSRQCSLLSAMLGSRNQLGDSLDTNAALTTPLHTGAMAMALSLSAEHRDRMGCADGAPDTCGARGQSESSSLFQNQHPTWAAKHHSSKVHLTAEKESPFLEGV